MTITSKFGQLQFDYSFANIQILSCIVLIIGKLSRDEMVQPTKNFGNLAPWHSLCWCLLGMTTTIGLHAS